MHTHERVLARTYTMLRLGVSVRTASSSCNLCIRASVHVYILYTYDHAGYVYRPVDPSRVIIVIMQMRYHYANAPARLNAAHDSCVVVCRRCCPSWWLEIAGANHTLSRNFLAENGEELLASLRSLVFSLYVSFIRYVYLKRITRQLYYYEGSFAPCSGSYFVEFDELRVVDQWYWSILSYNSNVRSNEILPRKFVN